MKLKKQLKVIKVATFFALFGVSLLLLNCEIEDNTEVEIEAFPSEKPKSNIDFNTFLNKFGIQNNVRVKASNKTFSLDNYKFGSNSNVASRQSQQSIIQYIDTTTIVAFEFDYIQTYTFKVVPTIETENTFYNIIFYQNKDGMQSKLLKYVADYDYLNNLDSSFSGTIYEIEQDETILNTYVAINDTTSDLANRMMTTCAYSTSIVSVNCSGDNHYFGDPEPCKCGTQGHDCTPAYQYTVMDMICVTYTTGGGSNPDDGSSSGGGGTSTDDPNQNDNGTFNLPTVPVKGEIDVEEMGRRKECKKISDLLNDNPTYLSKIQNIATKVSEDKEYSLSIHEDGSEHNEVGTVGSGGIDYPEYSSKYKLHMHTHDSHGENGQGTLSVYSIEDLIMYAKLAHYDKLDSGTFVAFLATNDGTNYALTINDKNKLIDLFYDRLSIPLTVDNALKYGANTQKVEDLFDKYYDPKNANRKLKVDSQNPGSDLVHFMNLLSEGDMGVSVFESTDNFQTFKNVALKDNSSTAIEKTPCN